MACLICLGVEVFGDGAAGEGGELGVGGEAQGDVLVDGEGVERPSWSSGSEGGEAELLFEADDAVLVLEGVAAGEVDHAERTSDMTIHQRWRCG